jgi:hypothetical protein
MYLAPDIISASAHQRGEMDYEPETHSSSVIFGFTFMDIESLREMLRMERFRSRRASGLLIFADDGSFGAAVLPFFFSRTEVEKILFILKVSVIYKVATVALTPRGSLSWPRDHNGDVKR